MGVQWLFREQVSPCRKVFKWYWSKPLNRHRKRYCNRRFRDKLVGSALGAL